MKKITQTSKVLAIVLILAANSKPSSAVIVHEDKNTDGLTATITSITNLLCGGSSAAPIGSATVTASGGSAPYSYLWSDANSQTSATATGLSAGNYTVVVTDNMAETASATAFVNQPPKLSASVSSYTNPSCIGSTNGNIILSVNGGTPPYTYLWIPPVGSDSSAIGLTAGSYSVNIFDNNNCSTDEVISLRDLSELQVNNNISNVSCHGGLNGYASAFPGSGIPPYTYNWSPGGETSSTITGLSAGIYTLSVTDAIGCSVSENVPIGSPTAMDLNTFYANDTVALVVVNGGTSPYTYAWYPGGNTNQYLSGISAGTYTVIVVDAHNCNDTATLTVNNRISIPADSLLRYPRWSKRGVQVEYADGYYYPPDSLTVKGGALADYCFKNHITYVLLDGVYYGTHTPYGAFNIDYATVNATYGTALQSLIYMLKTRGHVEQVGVECYPSDSSIYHDTGSYAVKNFNVGNFVNALHTYNLGLTWQYKIDILSLDEEFWDKYPFTYLADLNDFYSAHLPMLKAMYNAAHSCDANFLRVEDDIAMPFNPDTLGTNITQDFEMDSICKYADRILIQSYTKYPSVLWDRNDWVPGYQEIGRNPGHFYYKKEIWPMFDAANLNNHTCDTCDDGAANAYDFLGDSTCFLNTTSVNMEQRWYYQYYDYSMEHRLWTPNNVSTIPMGADTCFEVLGNMWYQYRCLKKICHFDTLTNEPSNTDTVLPIWVTLGHDTQWHGGSTVLTAIVHGGTSPYSYVWYNDANGAIMHGAVTRTQYFDTLTVFSTNRILVLVVDARDSTAIDYINVYNNTCYTPMEVPSIPMPNYVVDLFPNPANTSVTIEMAGAIGKQNYFGLYDLLSQKVESDYLNDRRSTINVSSLKQGVYFYQISSLEGKLWSSGKLVIIH